MVIPLRNLVDFFSFQLCPESGDNYFQIRWPMWFPPRNVLLGLFMGPLKAANSIVFRPQGSLLFFKLILKCIRLSASRVFRFKWRKTSFLMVLKTRGLLLKDAHPVSRVCWHLVLYAALLAYNTTSFLFFHLVLTCCRLTVKHLRTILFLEII